MTCQCKVPVYYMCENGLVCAVCQQDIGERYSESRAKAAVKELEKHYEKKAPSWRERYKAFEEKMAALFRGTMWLIFWFFVLAVLLGAAL